MCSKNRSITGDLLLLLLISTGDLDGKVLPIQNTSST